MTGWSGVARWLPAGKRAAVCWSVDDVHPARSTDPYEAGGDGLDGALGEVARLLESHPELRVTLFVTPDWRPISVVPTRRLLARIPGLNRVLRLARDWPAGTMRLDRHPEFVQTLRRLPRTDIGLHGLHHLHRGPSLTVEFQDQSRRRCRAILTRALEIFDAAGLPCAAGLQPPRWNLPSNLAAAARDVGLDWVVSGRDVDTPVGAAAVCAGSGRRGVSLLRPEALDGGLVHFPVNYQATSSIERAFAILDAGGLLSIKAHITKNMLGYVMKDGLDGAYRQQLDRLFRAIGERYGDALWWTSFDEIAARCRARDLGSRRRRLLATEREASRGVG